MKSDENLMTGCVYDIHKGVLCADWTALMPQSIEALKGSCVRIPCSFTLGYIKAVDYNPCLKTHSCNAIWMRGGTDKTNTVGSSPSGNLNQNDCTTILDNMPTGDELYFRLECGNCVMFNFGTPVQINIADTPPTPTLTPATVEVREGTSVSLICSATAPCPSLHPTLTWTPSLGQSEEGLQENQDKTQVKTSSLTFTASYLHHEQNISCTALYKQQDGKSVKSPETSLTVTVLFSPKNTSVSVSPSGSVLEGSSVTLTCSGNANPAVSYTWYRVNGVQVTTVGSSRMLTIQVSANNSQFYCEARNDHGSENSSVIQLDLPYPPMYTSVLVSPSGPVVEGSSVTLTCSSNANPAVKTYTWYRVNGVQVTSIGHGEKHQTQVYIDQRKFYCEAKNVHGTQNASVFELDVMYSPKNTSVSGSPSGSMIEGSSVTLTCNSNANPAVKTYTWYTIRGGRQTPVKNMPELTVQVLTDNSMFYCEAKNDHGIQKSSAFQLDMMYPPKNTSVSVSPSGSVLEGSSVTLTCSSNANPAGTYAWYRVNGDQVTSIGHGNKHQTQVYTDHRQFYCGATNDHGTKNSSVIELDVLYPPKNTSVSVSPSGSVLEGSSVTLTCSSNANPAVKNYTWYRVNGDHVTQIAHERELKTEASIDNHQFYCEARNDHGTKNSSIILLNVLYPPKNSSVSVSPSSSAIEGSSVTLTCSSNANPPVGSYTWYRVNQEQVTEVGSSRMLTIKVPADISQFYCETRNRLGSQNSSVTQLDGMYPAKNTSLSVSPSGSVVEGSSVTLTCSSNANPAVKTYTWYRVNGREGVIVGSGQSFTFNKIAINDSGRYYCEAENKHGVDNSTTTNIDVTFAPKILPSSRCIRTADQINCTCESHGNPSPKLEWRLAGQPVNHLTNTVVRESMGSTCLRSSLTTHQSQEEDTPTLVCLSTNSIGSSSLQFCIQCLGNHQGLGKSVEILEGQVSLPIFITAIFVSALMTALICGLLYLRRVWCPCFTVLRGHYKYYDSDVGMNLVPTSGERTQDPPAPEEDIYANSMIPSQARRQGHKQDLEAPNPGPKPLPSSKAISETDRTSLPNLIADTATNPGGGTAKKEGEEVFYSSVIWKKKKWMKKKNEGSVDGGREASSGSYLEEERCVLGNVGRHRISKVLEMDHLQFL